jgi:hypothetical protein
MHSINQLEINQKAKSKFSGFDSYLALKGIQWDDKRYFFTALEESVATINETDDENEIIDKIKVELAATNQNAEKFKLKLGHKNLIINLCNELQKTKLEDFNAIIEMTVKTIPEIEPCKSVELVIKNQLIEEEEEKPPIKKQKLIEKPQYQEVPTTELYEQVQYIYETEDDDDQGHYLEQEYIDENTEIVEYQEVENQEQLDQNAMFNSETITKEVNFDASENYTMDSYSSKNNSRSHIISGTIGNSKKPKHMYNEEYLHNKISAGTPSRRRPKLRKDYPETEEGITQRWIDLVRQSCEVIIPHDMLAAYDMANVQLDKIASNLWEVQCPMCAKKVRLQLTQEGKYVNFKRSNFERHLRIVHYRQIIRYQPREDESV